MTQRQISALIAAGVVACSTVLCWPGDYDAASALYRAIIINIANVFISEIPKFKDGKNTILNVIKSCLIVLGFVLLGIGLIRIQSSNKITAVEYIYFFASISVCLVSILNFIECMIFKEPTIPVVSNHDPSNDNT